MRWNGAARTLVYAALASAAPMRASGEPLVAYSIVQDSIPRPLSNSQGDEDRGRAIVANKQIGLCLLCHTAPIPEERLQGNLAPALAGAGARWTGGQLRLRVIDARQLNPKSIMPSYYKIDGLDRVAPAYRGKPILTASQIEDVVAYLTTLKE